MSRKGIIETSLSIKEKKKKMTDLVNFLWRRG